MKRIFIVIIFFFSQNWVFPKNPRIDALNSLLKKGIEDTVKINRLVQICWEYQDIGEYEEGLKYGFEALRLSRENNFQLGVADSYNRIAEIYRLQGNYERALEYHFSALRASDSIPYQNGRARAFKNIGVVFFHLRNYKKSLENEFTSLKIYEQLNSITGMSHCYNNIGMVYAVEKNYAEALNYYNQALEIKKKVDDKKGVAAAEINIGIIFSELQNLARSKGSLAEAKNARDKAEQNFFDALKICEVINYKKGVSDAYTMTGRLYMEDDPRKAIDFFKQGLAVAKSIHAKEYIMNAFKGLFESYNQLSDFKNAYAYHTKYSEIKDSLLNEESSKQIAEMQTKYETEKKEQQITLLNKDKELQDAQLNRQQIVIWSVAGGFLVVLVLSIFIFRERKKSDKLLLNILPAETAEELKKNGKAKARHYESVTVMFTDFKGFTAIAEKLSAEELVSELDFIFKKFDEIISRYNIEKIKTIGDAYMCVSGLPIPHPDHAEEIVKASLEIQNWMLCQNGKWQLRIGIHSGPVTAGVVGNKKFAYDIWGDTVNTASRMESSGKTGRINISGVTHELIKNIFICQFRGKIPAKNMGEIEMYFIEQA